MDITIPNDWRARDYQAPLYDNVGFGREYQHASVIWHRRAGKDSTMLNLTAREMFKRIGTYWHLFPEQAQARKAIWNGIDRKGRRIIDQVFPPEIRVRKSEQEMLIETVNGSIWQLAGSDNYDSLVGSNPVGVCFSEYALSNPVARDYIRPILLENGGWELFNTTPRGRNHAYELHMMAQENPDWFDQILTIRDTGVLTEEDMDAERANGVSESKIQQEYFCSFEAETEEQFIPSEHVTEARRREPLPDVDDPVVLGVDVARFGDDKTVIYARHGRDAQSRVPEIYSGLDTMQVASRVVEAMERYGAKAVFVDDGGVGGGVVDRLHQLGHMEVRGVNFGRVSDRRAPGLPVSANKRTEMWVSMRDALANGLAIPSDDALSFELLAPQYDYDKENRIILEKKSDMKKRGVRSPDIADALALTFAYPVAAYSVARQLEDQATAIYDPFEV